MEATGTQKASQTEVLYVIKSHDMSIPFSSKDGYDDAGAISRAQTMIGSPGLILYKKVGNEKSSILYEPPKRKR